MLLTAFRQAMHHARPHYTNLSGHLATSGPDVSCSGCIAWSPVLPGGTRVCHLCQEHALRHQCDVCPPASLSLHNLCCKPLQAKRGQYMSTFKPSSSSHRPDGGLTN